MNVFLMLAEHLFILRSLSVLRGPRYLDDTARLRPCHAVHSALRQDECTQASRSSHSLDTSLILWPACFRTLSVLNLPRCPDCCSRSQEPHLLGHEGAPSGMKGV
jgi:hypothetical protein